MDTKPLKTFTYFISREQLEANRAEAAAKGYNLVGDEGTAEVDVPFGTIGLAFRYDGRQLTVDVLHKPRFVGMGKIESELGKAFGNLPV